ncbi:hypothetical protein M501DRAFT_997400 [Patellaria atrata CBS 101060]|uniref:Ribosomal protein S21 n=1 Tax=Patellaria atrata CBS 101060 TaxID=1346257 RepID=A0A9P4S6F5_9PEZI|nr:hypothetical protein M501DRAFT_997400 [Patellaria atrata CBS 101060]
MEVRKAGEALWRTQRSLFSSSSSIPRLQFLNSRRCLSTTPPSSQRSAATASELFSSVQESSSSSSSQPRPQHPKRPPQPQYPIRPLKGISESLTSAMSYRREHPPRTPTTIPDQPKTSRTRDPFGSEFSPRRPPPPPNIADTAPSSVSLIDDITTSLTNNMPYYARTPNYTLGARLQAPIPKLPLGPKIGRTIDINPHRGMDIGRGIKQLGIMLARNKVQADLYRQRYHERPGLKRKRLHSQRWRRRFREGFNAAVRRVQKMTHQGW